MIVENLPKTFKIYIKYLMYIMCIGSGGRGWERSERPEPPKVANTIIQYRELGWDGSQYISNFKSLYSKFSMNKKENFLDAF